jgi:hypothetical protein
MLLAVHRKSRFPVEVGIIFCQIAQMALRCLAKARNSGFVTRSSFTFKTNSPACCGDLNVVFGALGAAQGRVGTQKRNRRNDLARFESTSKADALSS